MFCITLRLEIKTSDIFVSKWWTGRMAVSCFIRFELKKKNWTRVGDKCWFTHVTQECVCVSAHARGCSQLVVTETGLNIINVRIFRKQLRLEHVSLAGSSRTCNTRYSLSSWTHDICDKSENSISVRGRAHSPSHYGHRSPTDNIGRQAAAAVASRHDHTTTTGQSDIVFLT